MRWFVCTRSEHIDAAVATKLLHSLQHGEAPTLSSDPSSALAAASKHFLSVVRQRTTGRSEADAVFVGSNNVGALLLPTCPARLVLQALLDAIRVDGALAERVVSLSISAFPGPTLEPKGRHIAAQLAETAGIEDTLSRPGNSGKKGAGFDKFLLNFGERRNLGEAVEIRSVVEYDAIIDALFGSRTFQNMIPLVSLKVEVKSSARTFVRDEADDAPYWYAEARHTFWFLNKTHAAQYAQLATTQGRSSMARPLLVFQFFSEMQEVVWGSERIDELGSASAAIDAQRGHHVLDNPEDVSSPVSARIRNNIETLKKDSGETTGTNLRTPQPKVSGDSSALDSTSQRPREQPAREDLESEYARLEAQFNDSVRLHREESAAKKDSESELEAWAKKIEAAVQERDAADLSKKALAEEVSELSLTKKQLEQRVQSAAGTWSSSILRDIAAEMSAQQQQATLQFEEAMRNASQHGEDVIKTAQEEAARDISSKQAVALARRDALKTECANLRAQLAAAELAKQSVADRLAAVVSVGAATAGTLSTLQQSVADAHRAVEQIGYLGWSEGTIASERRVAEFEAARVLSSVEELRIEKARLLAEKQRHDAHIPVLEEKLRARTDGSLNEVVDLRLRVAARNKTIVFDLERLENLRRDTLRLVEATAREQLLTFEAQHWHAALHATEVAFVSEGQTKVRSEIFASDQQCDTIRLTIEELKGKMDELKRAVTDTAAGHAELLADTRAHLATIQREEAAMLEYDTKQEHFSFPELDEEAARLQMLVERLRVCMTCGAVGNPSATAAPPQGGAGLRAVHRDPVAVPLAGRAKAAGRVVPDARAVRDRLRRLIDDGKAQEEAWVMARETTNLKCDREQREHEERRAVLAQSAGHLDALKRRLEQCAQSTKHKGDDLDVRRARHEQLIQKLREEQQYADVMASRHRDEVDTHLRALRDKNEEVNAEIDKVRREIRKLELHAETARLQNSAAHAETLKLQIMRERERGAELRSQLLLPPR